MIGPRNALTCHPETPCQHVRAISVRVQRKPDGAAAFAFRLDGSVGLLRVPPPGPPRRADGLWQHTCFEAFLALNGATAYYEFNFAPSGEWAAYSFLRYREGNPLDLDGQPAISVRRAADRFELDAMIRVDRLPAMPPNAPLRLGLSAVLEDQRGERSYWALWHPPGKPDFHHPDAFALRLAPAAHDPDCEAGR